MAASTYTVTVRWRWWCAPVVKVVVFLCIALAMLSRGRVLVVPERLLRVLLRRGAYVR